MPSGDIGMHAAKMARHLAACGLIPFLNISIAYTNAYAGIGTTECHDVNTAITIGYQSSTFL